MIIGLIIIALEAIAAAIALLFIVSIGLHLLFRR